MPVDKFGKSGSRTEATQSEITFANLSNTFLKGDGTNTVVGTIDMDGHSIKKYHRSSIRGTIIKSSGPICRSSMQLDKFFFKDGFIGQLQQKG